MASRSLSTKVELGYIDQVTGANSEEALIPVSVPSGELWIDAYAKLSDANKSLYSNVSAISSPSQGQVVNAKGTLFERSGSAWIPLTAVNVRSFGAKGDGVTDDSDAFEDWIEYLHSQVESGTSRFGGVTGYIPNGRYMLQRNVIKLYLRGVNIVGDGRGSVIFCGNEFPAGEPLVDGRVSINDRDFTINCRIENLALFPIDPDGADWDNHTPDRDCFWFTGWSDSDGVCGFRNIDTRGFARHYRTAGSWVVSWENIRALGPSTDNRGGTMFSFATFNLSDHESGFGGSSTVNFPVMNNVSGTYLSRQFDWRIGFGGQIKGIRCEQNDNSLAIILLHLVRQVVFEGYFEGNTGIVFELGGTTSLCEGVTLSNSVFDERGSGAIVSLRNVRGFKMVNNTYHSSNDKQTVRTPSSDFVLAENCQVEYQTASLDSGVSALKNWFRVVGSLEGRSGKVKGMVRRNAVYELPTGEDTTLPWTTTVEDNGGFFTIGTSATALVVPAGITKVRVSAYIAFEENATGYRRAYINKNNSSGYYGRPESVAMAATGAGTGILLTSPILTVEEGDEFRVRVEQTSGETLDILSGQQSWFAIEAV